MDMFVNDAMELKIGLPSNYVKKKKIIGVPRASGKLRFTLIQKFPINSNVPWLKKVYYYHLVESRYLTREFVITIFYRSSMKIGKKFTIKCYIKLFLYF